MYLSEVAVKNFKPYESATLTLPQSGMVFIAGPNNSGKTALLAAFDVVAGRSGAGTWRSADAKEPATVRATFTLSEDERRALIDVGQQDAIRDQWIASDAFATLQVTFSELVSRRMMAESVAVTSHTGALALIARVEAHGPGNGAWSQVNLRGLTTQIPGVNAYALAQAGSGTMNDGLQALRIHPNVYEIWRRWAEPLYHFSGVRTGTPARSQISAVTPKLEPTGSNLAESLLYLYSQKAPAWNTIQTVMKQVLPDVGEVVPPVEGNQVEVAVIDPFSSARRNIKDLGAGVEQVLMTTYVGATQPPGSVILIEEPETNLHAAAERELLRHLIEWGRDRLIVLSTHSTVFLDQAATAAAGTWVVERKDGRSVVRLADTNFTNVLRAIGVRLSDILSAEQLILVEGETDAEILQTWFPELVLTRRTSVVPLGGGDRAYQVQVIENVFKAADELGRQIIFLRDADHLSFDNRQKLEALSRVTILGRREVENYLLEPAAILAVLAEREADPGAEVAQRFSEAELKDFIEETADALKAVVILKSVADELVPIRLIDRATIRTIASRGGGLAELRTAVESALPEADATLADVDRIWSKVENETAREWPARKLELAPGAEILTAIWEAHGGRYDKRRDGARIAAAMSSGPDELRQALADFLTPHGTVPGDHEG